MMRLLIVDDMPIIVRGLYQMFIEQKEIELDVYKAFSAFEALEILDSAQIDIIISDIRMPKMSGIELLQEIKQRGYPAKVIFLTSYQDFDYAKEAVEHGGMDLILKTEGDERILQSVLKAVKMIKRENEARLLVEKAKRQYKLAQPMLQKNFLLELIQGKPYQEDSLQLQFENLDIPFQPNLPIFLTLMRIDSWKMAMSWSDRALLIYAVQNVMHEYLTTSVHLISFEYNTDRLICLWQPKISQLKEWNRSFLHVYRMLETVQNTCGEMFHLKVSFILSENPVPWGKLPETLTRIELLSQNGIGLNSELLITDGELQSNELKKQDTSLREDDSAWLRMDHYTVLINYLASGKQNEYFKLYDQLVNSVHQLGAPLHTKLEVTCFLNSMILGYINRRNMFGELLEWIDPQRLYQFSEKEDWHTIAEYYRKLALLLFQKTTQDQENKTMRLVLKVQAYIHDHLDKDLSLTLLADYVHLNPSYLSRLYKQVTDIGISDYIMDLRIQKAKDLLRTSDMLIYEIAEAVGYQSGIAFTRFFKKVMKTTPQEYRDTIQS